MIDRLPITRREAALCTLVGTLALVIGVWVGVWSVPARALDVPAQTAEYGRGLDLAYRPVPTSLLGVSVVSPLLAAWAAWRVTHPPEDTETDTPDPATDGGLTGRQKLQIEELKRENEQLRKDAERYHELTARLPSVVAAASDVIDDELREDTDG